MAANLTILTHKIAIQLHLVAESCTICSSRSRRPVRKLLDTPSYVAVRQKRCPCEVRLKRPLDVVHRKSIYLLTTKKIYSPQEITTSFIVIFLHQQ
jgi:hypothetical protein